MDHAIVTKGLTRLFGRVEAVWDLDLEIPGGCVYGLLGRNGVGKTTLIRMLMGLLPPSWGWLRVLGCDTTRDAEAARARLDIGYLSQDSWLDPNARVSDVVRLVGGFYPAWDADLAEQLAERLDLPIDGKVKALSRGMETKLRLLLCLPHRPKLLILDEPTLGLDPVARIEILDLISQIALQGDRTILLATQLLGDVERIADHVGILDGGELLVSRPLQELQESVKQLRVIFPEPVPDDLDIDANVLSVSKSGRRADLVVADYKVWQTFLLENYYGAEIAEVIDVPLERIFLEYTGEPCPTPPTSTSEPHRPREGLRAFFPGPTPASLTSVT